MELNLDAKLSPQALKAPTLSKSNQLHTLKIKSIQPGKRAFEECSPAPMPSSFISKDFTSLGWVIGQRIHNIIDLTESDTEDENIKLEPCLVAPRRHRQKKPKLDQDLRKFPARDDQQSSSSESKASEVSKIIYSSHFRTHTTIPLTSASSNSLSNVSPPSSAESRSLLDTSINEPSTHQASYHSYKTLQSLQLLDESNVWDVGTAKFVPYEPHGTIETNIRGQHKKNQRNQSAIQTDPLRGEERALAVKKLLVAVLKVCFFACNICAGDANKFMDRGRTDQKLLLNVESGSAKKGKPDSLMKGTLLKSVYSVLDPKYIRMISTTEDMVRYEQYLGIRIQNLRSETFTKRALELVAILQDQQIDLWPSATSSFEDRKTLWRKAFTISSFAMLTSWFAEVVNLRVLFRRDTDARLKAWAFHFFVFCLEQRFQHENDCLAIGQAFYTQGELDDTARTRVEDEKKKRWAKRLQNWVTDFSYSWSENNPGMAPITPFEVPLHPVLFGTAFRNRNYGGDAYVSLTKVTIEDVVRGIKIANLEAIDDE